MKCGEEGIADLLGGGCEVDRGEGQGVAVQCHVLVDVLPRGGVEQHT